MPRQLPAPTRREEAEAGNEQKQSIREVLAKYGTVEVYDTNGKKME
jgi:hypothetical protein